MRLLPSFFDRSTIDCCHDLLGCFLTHKNKTTKYQGIITEVEAYIGPNDRASHASHGRTPRTETMFSSAGVWYVYLIYGMYYCLNIVTEQKNYPAAILIRGIIPTKGIEKMKKNRHTDNYKNLTNGPGKICQAFAIDKTFNNQSIKKSNLYLEKNENKPNYQILTGPRIGVDYAGEDKNKPWRFFIKI